MPPPRAGHDQGHACASEGSPPSSSKQEPIPHTGQAAGTTISSCPKNAVQDPDQEDNTGHCGEAFKSHEPTPQCAALITIVHYMFLGGFFFSLLILLIPP